MDGDTHAQVGRRLRGAGQRYTPGRRQLVDLLGGIGRPVTIPEILGAGADLSQSSLYRNLTVLEQCGVVHRVVCLEDAARFELSEELTAHHHHLVCRACGTVLDFDLTSELERAIARTVGQARETRGFAADGHRFELVGTCADCA